MSKKILSVALVVVMLVSIFAFSTNAADLTTGQIGIKIESDAVVGAPAGTVVTVKATLLIPEGEEVQLTFANISLGYDNTAYSVDTSSFAWGSFYQDVFKTVSTTCNGATTISNNIVKKFNDADKANGWNAGVQIQEAQLSGGEYTTKTGYPVETDCELFTLQFTTLKTLTEADAIGVVTGALGSNFFNFKQFTESTTAGIAYDAANVVLTEAVAKPGVAALEKVTGKIRVNGSAVDLGYIGKSDMAVTVKAVYGGDGKTICGYTVDSNACGIAGVGIEAKVDGVTQSSTASKIYLNGSITDGAASETVQGGFQFLPALTSVGANALTSTIEIRTYVLKTDGSYVYSEWVELDAKTTYDNAVAAGMADIFA